MSCRSSPATHTLGSTRRSVWFSSVSLSGPGDRKSTRLNSSHANISYAVFCLKKNIQIVVKSIYDIFIEEVTKNSLHSHILVKATFPLFSSPFDCTVRVALPIVLHEMLVLNVP